MKKFLLTALLGVSNVMATSITPDQTVERQAYPQAELIELSKQDDPKEEDIQRVCEPAIATFHTIFLCATENIAGMAEEVYKKTHKEPIEQDPQLKAFVLEAIKKEFESLVRSEQQSLKDWRVAEMECISREATESEKTAISQFTALLNLPKNYLPTNVRVVDAHTYINGLFLARARKEFYLHCLDLKVNIDATIRETFSVLTPPELSRVINLANTSQTYRDMIVSFLARQEAKPPLSSRYFSSTDSDKAVTFIRGTESLYQSNQITLDTTDTHYYNTLFTTDTIRSDGKMCLFLSTLESGLFHEVGHHLDPLYAANYCDSKEIRNDDSFIIAGSFLEKPTTATSSPLRKFLLGWKRFNTLEDIWQILGIGIAKNSKDEITLYINKMSDFSLCCETGRPIPMDHLGSEKEDISSSTSLDNISCYFPLKKYKALMEVYGYNLKSYVQKLQKLYPAQKTLADADTSAEKDSSDVEKKK